MLEILCHTLDRQGFLGEALVSNHMASAGDPVFETALGINLPDPPGIAIAGRSDLDVLRKVAE
jgi:hypothetical protein